MRLQDVIILSANSLLRNKSRAILTMLGIVIGVASVILMLSIGKAAEKFILSQVASFGSDLIFIRNGPGDGSQGSGPPTTAVKQTLTLKDYKKIRQQTWAITTGANIYNDALIEYGSEQKKRRVAGTTETEPLIYDTQVAQGSFYTADDIDAAANVAVLGNDLVNELFGQEDPIGKKIKIQKKIYNVIGIMEPAGTRFFTNLDKMIYIPVTSLMQDLNKDNLMFINVKIGNTPPGEAVERIRLLLRDTHKLSNPEGDLKKDDFFVATQEDAMKTAGSIGTILQVLLASIAAISLVVGGVGIMNIMYVTVTERTREIGLRKAIGALKRDVLRQFLFEAVFLTIGAGIIGIISGIFFSWLAIVIINNYQSGWVFVLPVDAILLGFFVSAAIGIIFGYFPAKTASKLNPIDALRYE